MPLPTRPLALALLLLTCTAPSVAGAVQVVLTLDSAPPTMCNEGWTESGVPLQMVATAPEDCDGGGNCFFGVGAAGVDMVPARLELDLTGLGVTSAEVDVVDFCGVGCTQAFLYDGATQVDVAANAGGGSQTLVLSAGGGTVDRLGVSSCEGSATEIRLETGGGPSAVPGLTGPGLLGLTLALVSVPLLRGARRRRSARASDTTA